MQMTVDFNVVSVLIGGFVFWTATVIGVMLWLNGQFNKLHMRLIKVELRLDLSNGHRPEGDNAY